jgi:hypothetical protein
MISSHRMLNCQKPLLLDINYASIESLGKKHLAEIKKVRFRVATKFRTEGLHGPAS